MASDTIEFPYYLRLGNGWTLGEIDCRVRIPTYNHADWEVAVAAYRPWKGSHSSTYRNIDASKETAVQELRAGIVWHVEETMRDQIEECVRAFRKGERDRQLADARAE